MSEGLVSMRVARRSGWPLVIALVAASLAAVWVWSRRATTPEARWRTIERAVEGRRWAEAEPLLAGWVASNPGDGRAWLQLGSVRGMLGRDPDAEAALARVARTDPGFARARVLSGDLALKRGDAAEAENAYRVAAEAEPDAVVPRAKLLGLMLVEWRKFEARTLLRDLYRLTGDPRHLIVGTGLALEESQPQQLRDLGGEISRLESELGRFLARSPDDPILRRARGLLRLEQGRTPEARDDLEFAAGRLDDDPAGRLALGECLLMLGAPDGLLERLGPAPRRSVLLGRWWLLSAQADAVLGNPQRAVASAREAVKADPNSRAAHYFLGRTLSGLGLADEARPFLDRAEAIRERTDRLKRAVHNRTSAVSDMGECMAVGELCLEAGLTAEARGWFERAARLDPTQRAAQIALARLGRPDEPAPIPPRVRGETARVAGPRPTPDRTDPDAGPRFEDVAARSGLVFRYDPGARDDLFIADTMGGGVGLLDVDGDGWLDVYFVNGCPLPVDPNAPPAPNRLFRNKGDGTFADVTAMAGVGGRGYGMGCAVGDYDGDGDTDLFVTGLGSTVLYRNNGDGTFTDATREAGVASDRWTTAAGFADLDGDGDLDLVVVTYVDAFAKAVPPCEDAAGKPIHCPPGKYPAQADHLFRNNGDGTFTDVAREAGLDVPNGRGLGLAVAELDGDGRLDLFVANDAVPDFLFLNRGGLKFEEVGAAAGAAYNGDGLATASMGVVAADLDGDTDGRVDLFHTNFRIEGNTFLRNLGGGQFTDATAAAGLDGPSRPVTGFGTAALDADNDGVLDLFVGNGHVDDQPWLGQPMAQPPHFYRGGPAGRFTQDRDSGPYFAGRVVARGAAAGDLDNDGRIDLVVVHRDAPAALLRNVSSGGHWLTLTLLGKPPRRSPVGAVVTVRAGNRLITRAVTTGTGYLSAHDPRLAIGLGRAAVVDVLEIRWPSGSVTRLEGIRADQFLVVREGEGARPAAPVPTTTR